VEKEKKKFLDFLDIREYNIINKLDNREKRKDDAKRKIQNPDRADVLYLALPA